MKRFTDEPRIDQNASTFGGASLGLDYTSREVNFRMKTSVAAVFLAILALASEAQAADTLTSNPVFERNCAKCHGKKAEGRHFGGPSLRSEKVRAATADGLRSMIINGKGRMPKFGAKLPAAEIDKLVQQIEAFATN